MPTTEKLHHFSLLELAEAAGRQAGLSGRFAIGVTFNHQFGNLGLAGTGSALPSLMLQVKNLTLGPVPEGFPVELTVEIKAQPAAGALN